MLTNMQVNTGLRFLLLQKVAERIRQCEEYLEAAHKDDRDEIDSWMSARLLLVEKAGYALNFHTTTQVLLDVLAEMNESETPYEFARKVLKAFAQFPDDI